MSKPRRVMSIKALETYFRKAKESGHDMIWRIGETLNWYSIMAESDSIAGSDELAYYLTGNWEEIVEFCSTHCNPGYDALEGLGCTEPKLYQATIDYIHSLGKKYRYE